MLSFLTGPDAAAQGSGKVFARDEMSLLERVQDLERSERDRRFERNAMRAEADSRAAELVALRKRIDSLEIMADQLLAELAHLKKQGHVCGSLNGNVHSSLEDATPRIVMDATHFNAVTKHFEANFVKISDFLAWVRETHDVIGRFWEVLTVAPGSTGSGSGVLDDKETSELSIVEETTAACQRLQCTVETLENLGLQINKQCLSSPTTNRSDGMNSSSRWDRHRPGTAEGAAVASSASSAERAQAATASHPAAKNRLLWNPDSQSETVE